MTPIEMPHNRTGAHRPTARAYTLLEVSLVLFAIALLSTIGVLTFGGAATHASDRIAQANVDAALSTMVNHAALTQAVSADPVELAAVTPAEIDLVGGTVASASAGEVSVAATATAVGAAAASDDGSCWLAYLALQTAPGAPARRYAIAATGATTPCRGEDALELLLAPSGAGAGSSWSEPVRLP